MADNVRVAVRLRPFNKRETERDAKLIITMNKATQQTTIANPAPEPGHPAEHNFTFDFSYNSFVPRDDPAYASQSQLWKDIGESILTNAYNGYNCSLFAYGQTGAGKSYSMMGYGEDKGIIPMACERIFDRIGSNTDPDLTIRVEASMLEIYMEKIRDLFNPTDGVDLKVRNHPKLGFYVQDLTRNAVSNYEQISDLMETGTLARTVASTNMNATSSRAHTVFQIILTQTKVDRDAGKATDKTAVINLIDLAGSERVSGTGAQGDRLKEGAAINLSLTCLGNVISALAKNSGDGKKVLVPYRDSVLTMLLQNSLGGNAKTVMIAALSPADINYDETLSTLRYANRAKQIKNKAVVNEDPNETLIRNLRDEIEELRKKIGSESGGGGAKGGMTMLGAKFLAAAAVEKQKDELVAELEEKLKLEAMESKSWDERLKETSSLRVRATRQLGALGVSLASDERVTKLCHLVNLNEDPMLSEKLRYFVSPATEVKVGSAPSEPPSDPSAPLTHVTLEGVGIHDEHCVLSCSVSGLFHLKKSSDACAVFVNGKSIMDTVRVQLKHNDRVFIGNNHAFKVVIPADAATAPQDLKVDFMFAFSEKNQAEIEAVKAMEAERRAALEAEKRAVEAQLKDMEEKAALERAAAEAEGKRKQEEMAKKQRELVALKIRNIGKDALKVKEDELARERAEFEAEQKRQQVELDRKLAAQRLKAEKLKIRQARETRARSMLEDQLVEAMLKVAEANAMTFEMAWGVRFFTKLMNATHDDAPLPEPVSASPPPSLSSADGAMRRPPRPTSSKYRLLRSASFERKDADLGDESDDDADPLIWDLAQVFVKVKHLETDEPSSFWPYHRFLDHLFRLRDMYQVFVKGSRLKSSLAAFTGENDPCFAPPVPVLVGTARIYLDPLQYGFHIDVTTPIVDFKHGREVGVLKVVIVPHLSDTPPSRVTDDDDLTEPLDLMQGRPVFFTIFVESAKGLPPKLCTNTFAQLNFFHFPHGVRSSPCRDRTCSPTLSWRHTFRIQITPDFCRYVSSEPLDIKVFAEYSPLPASDALFSPMGSMTPRMMFSPMAVENPLKLTEPQGDAHIADEAAVTEALKAALKRAMLFGKSKDDVLAIVNGLYD